VQHTLYTVLQDTFFFPPSPPPTIFSSLCILKSLESLPGRSCLGPLGTVCFSGNWRLSELDSRFWTSDTQDHPTSCRKFLYFTFLFVFSILYTDSGLLISRTILPRAGSSCTSLFYLYYYPVHKKMCWREHSLADTVPLLLTILQFSSELSKNWGIGLPCPWPSWIYCTGQQHKASLLPCLFSCLSSLFTIVVSWIVLIICTSLVLPHLHHYVTIPPECGLPLLGPVEFPF